MRYKSLLGPIMPTIGLMLVLISTPNVQAQCPTLCGDVNGGGTVSPADLIMLTRFLAIVEPLEFELECSDVDNYDLITLRDILYLDYHVGKGGPAPICSASNARFDPVPSSNYTISHTRTFPANESVGTIVFTVQNDANVMGVLFALQIRVDTEVPAIDSIIPAGLPSFAFNAASANPDGFDSGRVLAVLAAHGGGLTPGEHDVLRVDLSMAPASCPREITVEWIELPPVIDDQDGVPHKVNTLMVIDDDLDVWLPQTQSTEGCAVLQTGDFNLDDAITSADIISVVNYVFKSGCPALPVAEAADVNCSGEITSADVIELVNYVFKAGASPCDVCSIL